MRLNRMAGFAIIAAVYVIAAGIGVLVYALLPDAHIFLRILAGDTAATVFVFLTGVIFRNTSVYDPYWSVAPPVVLVGVAIKHGAFGIEVLLLLVAVCYWGIRLTANWAYTFKNLATQDWRYDMYKEKFPRLYQLVSFGGINMVPTFIVYLALLPGVVLIQYGGFNIVTILGFGVSIFAASLQLVADIQMHRFRRENAGQKRLIRTGLWRHARHPNYLGEILMWWGVYIIMLPAAPHLWWMFVCPLANTFLFLFISIPLADKRNRRERLGFDEYVKQTNSLLPIKLKNYTDEEVEEESRAFNDK